MHPDKYEDRQVLSFLVPVLSLIWVHRSSRVYGDADPGFLLRCTHHLLFETADNLLNWDVLIHQLCGA